MKKFRTFWAVLFLFVLAAWGLNALAREAYFVSKGGRTLYYERYKPGTDKLMQTTTLEMGDVVKDGAVTRVHYGMTLRKANGHEMYGGRAELVAQIDANGDVWMDFAATVKSILQNLLPHVKIKAEGDPGIIPAVMQPGDTLPDAHCKISVAGIKYALDVTERTALRKERITTPAGTFDCMVVREHKVENGPGHHGNTWSDTWYATGIGYVRHDTFDKKMRPEGSEILISY